MTSDISNLLVNRSLHVGMRNTKVLSSCAGSLSLFLLVTYQCVSFVEIRNLLARVIFSPLMQSTLHGVSVCLLQLIVSVFRFIDANASACVPSGVICCVSLVFIVICLHRFSSNLYVCVCSVQSCVPKCWSAYIIFSYL